MNRQLLAILREGEYLFRDMALLESAESEAAELAKKARQAETVEDTVNRARHQATHGTGTPSDREGVASRFYHAAEPHMKKIAGHLMAGDVRGALNHLYGKAKEIGAKHWPKLRDWGHDQIEKGAKLAGEHALVAGSSAAAGAMGAHAAAHAAGEEAGRNFVHNELKQYIPHAAAAGGALFLAGRASKSRDD